MNGLGDHLPDLFAQLHVFDVLGDIIEPSQQAKRISQCCQGTDPKACGNAQPRLLAKFDHDPILDTLDGYSDRGLAAGDRLRPAADLDDHPVGLAQSLDA